MCSTFVYFDFNASIADNVDGLYTEVLTKTILLEAFPRRGYIKSYLDTNFAVYNNLFIKYVGSGDSTNLDEGVLEKFYSFEINDIFETLPQTIANDISKLTEITLNPKI